MVLFIMMLGMVAGGSAVVFVKLGSVDPVVLSSYRLLIAAIALFPLFLKDLRARKEAFRFKQIVPSLLPGAFLAFHFLFFIIGTRLIPGAHASLITTLSPMVMPFLMHFMIRETITPREIVGSLLAMSGAFFLAARDYGFAPEYIKGDLLCFAGMIFVTLYLAVARQHRKTMSFWFYMVPLYAAGGLICLVIALIRGADFIPRSSGDWISILGLGVICTVAGHSINNFGMRRMRGQLVSLLNLTQIVFAAVLSYLVFAEVPEGYFYPSAVLILAGPLLVILADMKALRGDQS